MRAPWLSSELAPEEITWPRNSPALQALKELEETVHDAHDYINDGHTLVYALRCVRALLKNPFRPLTEWNLFIEPLLPIMTEDQKVKLAYPPTPAGRPGARV